MPPRNVKFTHVIVGAGSAGCVLASRLSEDRENRVLLVEAGPQDKWWNWKIHMPAALMYNLCDSKYNWYYHTEKEPYMDDRIMYWPRGRDCLPYFRKSETFNKGGNEYRGDSGPLHVTQGPCENLLYRAFIKAGEQAGFGVTDDLNGYRNEGVGPMDMTIYKGKRWSASQAYLHPALREHRDNLHVVSGTLVTRLLFDGKRCIGLEYSNKYLGLNYQDDTLPSMSRDKIYAEAEVILCGGAINSPQLLMLSGIGPAAHLENRSLPVLHHLPGVGGNLQDHLEVYVQQACTQPITLYNRSSWRFPHNMIRTGLTWFYNQTGDGASNHLEAGGFVRTEVGQAEHPDIQFHFLPSTVLDHGRVVGDQHAYQVHVGPMRPTSRGRLELLDTDPRLPPRIYANYLSTEQDRAEFRESVHIARKLFAQPAFDEFRGKELAPGPEIQSDDEIDAFLRAKGDSAYHPSCTCKMGPASDPDAVVDPQTMRVHGIDGLRIVDASVMPSIVSGNLNGPTIMVAEKAADLIRGREPLPRARVPIWTHRGDRLSA